MTLYQVINILKGIANTQPNVRTVGEGNIYDTLNANPSIKYGVFFLTQGTHTQDDTWDHYNFSLFYVDRLENDMESNRVQIQSIGKEVISNVVRTFENEYECESSTISFTPFTQRFADECCGVYAQLTFDIIRDSYCEEVY